MSKLLLIEDDSGISTPLSLYLENVWYDVIVCADGSEAENVYQREKPAIIILDINLPGKTGIEICRDIRSRSTTPIIMLSARESEEDKVTLLELGADDYVSKPFSSRELVARIAAVMKRAQTKKENTGKSKELEFWKIAIDTKNMITLVSGTEITLTKTEFSLLEYFVKNAKWVIKRDALMKDIIGYDNYIYDRTIDTHVKNLRKKLEWAIDIETVRGVWYRVNPID
jgi:two-component system, OmpR family, response regulator RegX3